MVMLTFEIPKEYKDRIEEIAPLFDGKQFEDALIGVPHSRPYPDLSFAKEYYSKLNDLIEDALDSQYSDFELMALIHYIDKRGLSIRMQETPAVVKAANRFSYLVDKISRICNNEKTKHLVDLSRKAEGIFSIDDSLI